MKIIDFSKSYMSWFGTGVKSSISRILLDGGCTLINSHGEKDVFYLTAPCRSEHTHSDGQLIVMPNYDFRGIFGSMNLDPKIASTSRFSKFEINSGIFSGSY